MYLTFYVCLIALPVTLASCSISGNHIGYITRSYSIRGKHYQPMPVNQALNYGEVGITAWYDESTFFGLKRGHTRHGGKSHGIGYFCRA
jgi:rare lipoprotein A